jgi:PIN domain nuclease of toxin-antitoxin system
MARDAVLDASAILALMQGEAGADVVAKCLPGARVCAVNLAEVVGKLSDIGMPEAATRSALAGLGLQVMAFGAERAERVGLLRPVTRPAGLSLGDRCCLELAQRLGLPALTADRSWASLAGTVEVELIR